MKEVRANAERSLSDANFIAGGYATSDYVQSDIWRRRFAELKRVSDPFVEIAWRNPRISYPWPHDPLNWWSRTWEYPWIASRLEQHTPSTGYGRLLDVGAAVTFFTAYLLRVGYEVTNLDYDPRMADLCARLFRELSEGRLHTAQPKYIVGDARSIPVADDAFDIVQCVSVLEHIPDWRRALVELARVLRPGGALVLTFDVRLNESSGGLSTGEASELVHLLREWSFQCRSKTDHVMPSNAITMQNPAIQTTLHALDLAPHRTLIERVRPFSQLPRRATRWLGSKLRREPEDLAIYGGIWTKPPKER